MKLAKFHGLGNEFLIASVDALPDNPDELARIFCDYSAGPGADGLIFNLPMEDTEIDAQMALYNSDGTRAEISGNGLRCLAHHVYLKQDIEKNIRIRTDVGDREAQIQEAQTSESLIRVEMGSPTIGSDLNNSELTEKVGAGSIRAGYVDVGNPHIVVQFENIGLVNIASLGPLIEKACSESGINVHVVEVSDRSSILMHTWERGVGVTKACGSGAVASACKTQNWGLVDSQIQVVMPGGEAQVKIENHEVYLTGKSEFVGEYEVIIGV